MFFESLCIFLISFAFGLVMFALGQICMLIFPACPGEEVTLPQFPRLGWKPVLVLAVIALVLAIPCASVALWHWFG